MQRRGQLGGGAGEQLGAADLRLKAQRVSMEGQRVLLAASLP